MESAQDVAPPIRLKQINAHDRKVDSASKQQQVEQDTSCLLLSPDTCTSEAIKHMQRNEPFPSQHLGWAGNQKYKARPEPPSRALGGLQEPGCLSGVEGIRKDRQPEGMASTSCPPEHHGGFVAPHGPFSSTAHKIPMWKGGNSLRITTLWQGHKTPP